MSGNRRNSRRSEGGSLNSSIRVGRKYQATNIPEMIERPPFIATLPKISGKEVWNPNLIADPRGTISLTL